MYLEPFPEGQTAFARSTCIEDEQPSYGELTHSSSSRLTNLLPSSAAYTPLADELVSISLNDSSTVIPSTLTSSIGLRYLIDETLEVGDSNSRYLLEGMAQASLIVQDQLTGMVINSDFDQILGLAFGDRYDRQVAASIQQSFLQGNFDELPLIRVVSSDILGDAYGAYVAQDDSIFLSDQLVASNNSQEIAAVILEEVGHAIDSRINSVDSPGDEGYIFSRLVEGESISHDELSSLQQEDDQAWLEYNGQMMLAEQSLPTVTLSVPDPSASEVNTGQVRNPGSFRAARTGSTVRALTVNYSIGGSATNGADYSRLSGSVVIPVGASSVVIPVNVINDNIYEGSETVNISLRPSSAYTLGASRTGTFTIADNDPAPRIVDTSQNDSLSTASFIGAWQRNISTINGQGFVGSVDPQDFYRFTLANTSNVTLTLSGIRQNSARLELIRDTDSDGFYDSFDRLYSDTAYISGNGVIDTALGSGTYFIRVATSRSSVNTSYVLSLRSIGTPPTTPSDPGSNLSTALNLGQLTTTPRAFRDFVGVVDPVDTYRFSLANTSNVNLTLSGVNQNFARLELVRDINGNGFYDSNERLYSDTAYTYDNGVINTALGAGAYFVRVVSPYNYTNTNYTLSLGATATPPTTLSDPGSNLSTALNLGRLTTTPRTFRDFVGVVDPVDTYRFSLANTSNVSLTLSGVSQNFARLELIRDINGNGFYDFNERLYSDTAYTYDNGVINTALGAGTYFVRIVSPYNYTNTNYTLSLRLVA